MKTREEVQHLVKSHYGKAALRAGHPSGGCCGPASADPISADLYSDDQKQEIPELAVNASLGCGNPTLLAQLAPGETVLDLGSGGGVDVLLSARRVGPQGKVLGLDMTDEMLELARRNQAQAGVTNVEFLKGTIEQIPLPDESVDVIISNCVINLSADKDQVLREAYRVLRPGGRFAVSDIVFTREVPEAVRRSAELWAGCIAGALHERDYRSKLVAAGFQQVELQTTRTFGAEDLAAISDGGCCSVEVSDASLEGIDGAMISAFVRARKPAQASTN
jgi:ubiquinone/menaquinone biosynthesis C-methylase UbiE